MGHVYMFFLDFFGCKDVDDVDCCLATGSMLVFNLCSLLMFFASQVWENLPGVLLLGEGRRLQMYVTYHSSISKPFK